MTRATRSELETTWNRKSRSFAALYLANKPHAFRPRKWDSINYLAQISSTWRPEGESLSVSAHHDWHAPRSCVQALKIQQLSTTARSFVSKNAKIICVRPTARRLTETSRKLKASRGLSQSITVSGREKEFAEKSDKKPPTPPRTWTKSFLASRPPLHR